MAWAYPVPKRARYRLVNSYWRRFIPGTKRRYSRGYHYGIDISARRGDHVVAVRKARVIAVGNVWGSAYGKQVLIRWYHRGRPKFAHYAHLDSIAVKAGQYVQKGQVVGHAGDTGQTTGVHVHFQLHTSRRWNRGMRNPYKALDRARRVLLASG